MPRRPGNVDQGDQCDWTQSGDMRLCGRCRERHLLRNYQRLNEKKRRTDRAEKAAQATKRAVYTTVALSLGEGTATRLES